jgi:hypothetical protein
MGEEQISENVLTVIRAFALQGKVIDQGTTRPMLACLEFQPAIPDQLGPSIEESRYAVLPVGGSHQRAFRIYDRLLSRIVDGLFEDEGYALDTAYARNHNHDRERYR